MLPLHAERQFYCVTPDKTNSHTWRVNGTVVTSNSTFPDVVYITSQTLSNGSTQGSLTFRADAHVNNSDIECFVTDPDHLVILPQLDYNIVIQGIYIWYIPKCWLTYANNTAFHKLCYMTELCHYPTRYM